MTDKPLVSVVMPSFNTEEFLGAAIESVLSQDLSDLELLVVDDGSTDGSLDLVNGFAARDPRVKLLANRRTKGVAGARNTGLDSARGEWVAFLDSDDELAPASISSRMDVARTAEGCLLIVGDFSYSDESGIREREPFWISKPSVVEHLKLGQDLPPYVVLEDPVDTFLTLATIVHTGTVLAHQSVIEAAGRFDESMTHGEDDHYWCRLGLRTSMAFLPVVVEYYRKRSGSASRDTDARFRGDVQLYQAVLNADEFRDYRAKAKGRLLKGLFRATVHFRHERKFKEAIGFALRAVRLDPTSVFGWRQLIASLIGRP